MCSLKSLNIQPPPLLLKTQKYAMKLSEMAFLSYSRWQNRKERPNGSTNNKDMVNKAKHDVVSCYIYLIVEKMDF